MGKFEPGKGKSEELSNEKWEPILDGYYAVSNLGRLMRLKGGSARAVPGKIISLNFVDTSGYRVYRVSCGGSRRTMLIHRLVAKAFFGPCLKNHEVNHKNGIKTDNRVENLEYVTHTQNLVHAFRLGLHPQAEQSHHAKLDRIKITEIIKLRKKGFSYQKIADRFDVNQATIQKVCVGENWKSLDIKRFAKGDKNGCIKSR